MASDHVHGQTQSQGDWAKNKGRENLDDEHQRQERARHAGWNRCHLEKADAVVAHTRVDEGHIGRKG